MVIAPSPENPAFAGMTMKEAGMADERMTNRDASPPPDTSAPPKKFTRMTEFFEDRFG